MKLYWNKDRCLEESKKYNFRVDFFKKSNSAYTSAWKNGWLDEICQHMQPSGNRYKRCIYAFEFGDKSVYIGLTYNIDKRTKQHLNDVEYNDSSVLEHIKKTNMKPKLIKLTDYVDVHEASILEKEYLEYYKSFNYMILNKSKCGTLGGNILHWTKDRCRESSILCKSRGEFKRLYPSAYNSSRINGWLDEICEHMQYICSPNNTWTKEKCKEEALKYKNRRQFNLNAKGAYNASLRNGWLDEVCSHMNTLKHGFWQKKENCMLEALKYNRKTDFITKSGGAYKAAKNNGWIDEICSHMKKN